MRATTAVWDGRRRAGAIDWKKKGRQSEEHRKRPKVRWPRRPWGTEVATTQNLLAANRCGKTRKLLSPVTGVRDGGA
jgi:hypothetical protein